MEETMQCDHCHEVVVDGVFCTRCGSHQGTTDDQRDARSRTHSYAAYPGEHVAHPALLSTLLPHLGQHKVHEFRWALLAGLAGVVLLWATGFITAAILVAAFLIPVLYLIYLYEAQVYQDEPATVVGFTIGGGAVLGIVLTLAVRALISPLTLNPGPLASSNMDWLALLGLAVFFPIVQEVIKPLPALVLRGRNFPETMDGLTFGVAAGIGYATAESIINFSSVIGRLPLQTTAGNWIFPLLSIAILQPVMQGTCTGILAASIWRAGKNKAKSPELLGIAGALAGHIAFSLGSQLLSNGPGWVTVLAWQTAVVVALLVGLRYLLHYALLEEGRDYGLVEAVCAHCHKHVMAAGFCPTCGMALIAAPHRVRQSRRSVPGAQPPPAEGPDDEGRPPGPPQDGPPAEPAGLAKEE
jgi:RsiW-degrading membrane proteinase PrsW (M82 family)